MFLHPTGKFDNSARAYRHIEVRPLAAAMGAEIIGVHIGQESQAQFAEIEDALFRHKMIYFRGQKVGHAEHHSFSARFGNFAEDAYTDGMPGFREVQPLIKEADDNSEHIFGSGWHTDSPFLPEPPAITMLRSVQIPPFGGDTMWTNSALAYSMLSQPMQRMIAGLKVHFSMRDVLASAQAHAEQRESPIGRLVAMKELSPAVLAKVRGNMHPLVRTHARSGEKALYLDPSYAIGLEGFREEEAAPLLRYLNDHLTQPAFTCRLRWETGMLALWDNRLCLHQAFNDYQGHRREMYRTTIAGEVPR
jgi:alpha-ketoglutarate-dependent taurine dioxygenase